MALDDDAQIDPSTLPENRGLLEELDAQIARFEQRAKHSRMLESRVITVLPEAVSRIEERVYERKGSYAREEELRGGLADALRQRGELVLTEAKLRLPGWTSNLGGFDLAIVAENSLVLGETKWADGNLHESMWDIFKLASALSTPRIEGAVAIYGAPAKHWQRPNSCALLFDTRDVLSRDLIWGLPHQWEDNLAGSSAKPLAIPLRVRLRLLASETAEIFGKPWEVRAISVRGDGGELPLEDGWPSGTRPATPGPPPW